MTRWNLSACALLLAMSAGAAFAAAPSGKPRWERIALDKKAHAERNVLAAVPKHWSHRRLRMFVDSRTGLLKNNVQAVCSGRGMRSQGQHELFVCVVRRHHARQRLLVSYRPVAPGRFRIDWLALRGR
jgi:hypothetical protein